MSTAQIEALGELIENNFWDAAIALCEANGYRFVKEYGSHYADYHIIRTGNGFAYRSEAIKALYEQLRKA